MLLLLYTLRSMGGGTAVKKEVQQPLLTGSVVLPIVVLDGLRGQRRATCGEPSAASDGRYHRHYTTASEKISAASACEDGGYRGGRGGISEGYFSIL